MHFVVQGGIRTGYSGGKIVSCGNMVKATGGSCQWGWSDSGARCLIEMYGDSVQFVHGRLAILAVYINGLIRGYSLQVAYYFHDHDILAG